MRVVVWVLLLACVLCCPSEAVAEGTFVAAVVQRTASAGASPAETVLLNAQQYQPFVERAAREGARIIVFPEFGLGMDPASRAANLPYCLDLPPSPQLNCSSSDSNALCMLASYARQHRLYVTVNVCERVSDSETYNTEVVFDEAGDLVARYRKTHPFFGQVFSTPPSPDYVSFNTSFGAAFGIFTCFDIVFPEPKDGLVRRGLRSFVYSYAMSVPKVGALSQELFTAEHCVSMLVSNDDDSQAGLYYCGKALPTTKHTEGLTNGSMLVGEVPMP